MSKFDRFKSPSEDQNLVLGMPLSKFLGRREELVSALTDEEREVLIAELEAMDAAGSKRVPIITQYKLSSSGVGLSDVPTSANVYIDCNNIRDLITAIRNHEGFEDIFRFRKNLDGKAPRASELLRDEPSDLKLDEQILKLNRIINEFGLYHPEKMDIRCIYVTVAGGSYTKHTAAELMHHFRRCPNSELSQRALKMGWKADLIPANESGDNAFEAGLFGLLTLIPHEKIAASLDQSAKKIGAPQEKVERVLETVAEKITNIFTRKK
ncbi:hypothetical protein COU74_02495 [Candidatus Peregrinibacteria bacterium CG10_big_fil_rev_8_21_14_0_10_36_19]|nr:MAG: hypothetical protein COU74_02495 [Candidatus Peregrinibacteria bacterium CG10_big_fil_rev_8_21_14_0_10_36_19]